MYFAIEKLITWMTCLNVCLVEGSTLKQFYFTALQRIIVSVYLVLLSEINEKI